MQQMNKDVSVEINNVNKVMQVILILVDIKDLSKIDLYVHH